MFADKKKIARSCKINFYVVLNKLNFEILKFSGPNYFDLCKVFERRHGGKIKIYFKSLEL